MTPAVIADLKQIAMLFDPQNGLGIALNPLAGDKQRGRNPPCDQSVKKGKIRVPRTGIKSEGHTRARAMPRFVYLQAGLHQRIACACG
jgi:hypothetical protein